MIIIILITGWILHIGFPLVYIRGPKRTPCLMPNIKHKDRAPPDAEGLGTSADETAELVRWIEAGSLPELNPTRQARSLRTTVALLAAGARLLQARSLEDFSVEEVCREAGLTVGSFYGRFEGKHAFFVTMQRIQVLRAGAELKRLESNTGAESASLDEFCRELVQLIVHRFRQDVGVLRASLQHTQEGMWEPFRLLGDRYRATLIEQVSPLLKHLPPRQRQLRVQFAFQALTGTLVHAVLNNPGPLMLDDPRLVPELTRLLRAYLNSE